MGCFIARTSNRPPCGIEVRRDLRDDLPVPWAGIVTVVSARAQCVCYVGSRHDQQPHRAIGLSTILGKLLVPPGLPSFLEPKFTLWLPRTCKDFVLSARDFSERNLVHLKYSRIAVSEESTTMVFDREPFFELREEFVAHILFSRYKFHPHGTPTINDFSYSTNLNHRPIHQQHVPLSTNLLGSLLR